MHCPFCRHPDSRVIDSRTADDGVAWVRQLVAGLPILKLREYGLREEHFAGLVTKATNASSMKANPVKLTPAELTEVLRQAT